ncbi:MAG TPA: hypothetical protein VD833_25905 [Vicinamibacterales bacterium]|nr:hypothetical protein [Vicinamibacterales bacterium]
MGYEASCALTIDGKRFEGTALLEHRDLVFRGPLRLVIPLAAISRAQAEGPILQVTFGDRDASFDIGAPAARWASRITNPPSRARKLGIKPDMLVAVLGVDDAALPDEIATCGAVMTRRTPSRSRPAHVIFYGAPRRDALRRVKELASLIRPDGAIWIVRPKGVKTITEAETMAAGKRAGLVDVKVVSFSDSHTAEKFVIPVSRRQTAVSAPGRRRLSR